MSVQIGNKGPENKKVAAVVYDGLCSFEFGICAEVFGLARPEFDAWYEFIVCSAEPGPLHTGVGLRFEGANNLEALDDVGTILLPGWRSTNERPPPALLEALRRAHQRGARLLSICSGVFILAAAGLLDNRRATTHWRYCQVLADAFPAIKVAPDVLYIDEGNILTSAGSAAGLDLCLHLVRRDWGAEIANAVARRLVVPAHREGGQAQYIERPIQALDNPLSAVLDWARQSLDQNLNIKIMAGHANMSTRTFLRRFRSVTGFSPGAWLQSERLLLARELLENTDKSIEQIATLSGLGSAENLRHHFRSQLGVSPSRYRINFRASGDAGIDERTYPPAVR